MAKVSNINLWMIFLSLLHYFTFIYENEVISDFEHVANVSSCLQSGQLFHSVVVEQPANSIVSIYSLILLFFLARNFNKEKFRTGGCLESGRFVGIIICIMVPFVAWLLTWYYLARVKFSYNCKGYLLYWYIAVLISFTLIMVLNVLLCYMSITKIKTINQESEDKIKNYFKI